MKRDQELVIYPQDKNGHRTGTTIVIVLRDGDMYWGDAILNPTDQFCKKTGRDLARARAEKRYTDHCKRVGDEYV
jgi:hypothetical protein